MPDYYDGKASKQEETNNSTGNGSRVSKFDSNNFGLDVASLKIIELSKKIRELNAALVSERNKCNNLHQVIRKLESNSTNSLNKELVCHLCKRNKIGSLDEKIKSITECAEHEKKLKKMESVILELRQKVQILNHDLLLAKKVVEAETGETVPNVNTWLASIRLKTAAHDSTCASLSNWRGRQQQIAALKNRIEKLQSQLNSRTISHSEDLIYKPTEEDETFSGATSFGVSYLQDDNDLCTRKLYDTPSTLNRLTERDLTKSSEKQLQNDKRRLEDDLNSTKSKLQKTKQRVNSLLQERKELKQQIIFLVQKGKHDDELVESLVQRTGDLQRELTNMSHLNTEKEQDIEMLKQKLSSLEQRKDMEVGKLNEIIAEKNENMEKLNQLLTETKQKQLDELNRDMNEAEYDGKVKNNSSYTGSECELVSSFTIERNGFLTLVANMESRIGELLCQINTLEMQNAKLVRRNEEKQNSKTKISTAITSKHKTTNTSDNRANENDAVLDYLLHNDYLKDAISQCNLSAHSAKIITKRIKELQNALYNSQDEITSLKGSLKLTLYYRKEDLKLVMQMVDDIRRQNKNGAI